MKLFQFMRTPKKEDFSYLDPSSEEDLLASFSSPRPPRRVRKRKLEDWITSRVRLTRVLPGLRPDDANDRSPPPPPTSLDFPTWAPKAEITPFTEAASERIHTQFASLRGVAGIRDEHLEALNLTCEGEVPFETLIPDNSFLPPREGAQQTSPAKSPNARLNNGKEAPGIEIFHTRSADVLLENDDAFRALTRRPPREGRSAVKLGHFYKFWQGLELMSQYWDSSLDNYYEEDVVIENGDKNQDGEPMDVDGTKKRRREKYTGRRLGNGKDMPDLYREDTVRGFIEPIAWLFGCHVLSPRMQSRFVMRRTLFPVRISHTVFRTSLDRQRARNGLIEGPVLVVQCRSETVFHGQEDTATASMAERLNLLREVGAGLIIAQERAREGKQQMRPGEGQWYTTVPRWGGGVGGEVGNATGNTDESAPKKEDKKNGNRAKSRKEANAEAYKRVAPGPGNWDPKVTYSHIGKESRGDVDHIYLVSSLNHHVSIVQLRVHASYLQFLESGKLPSDQDYPMSLDGTPWYELRMCRTKWFDLFCAEDRLELMRGFWGIMAWMMRGET